MKKGETIDQKITTEEMQRLAERGEAKICSFQGMPKYVVFYNNKTWIKRGGRYEVMHSYPPKKWRIGKNEI